MSRIRSQAWLGAAGSLLLMTSYLACSGMKAEDKKEEPAANKAPSVTVIAPKGAVNTESGYSITFQAEGKDPDMGDTVVAFVWNFDDGTPEKEIPVTAENVKGTVEHAFKGKAGEKKGFAVKVKAKDKYGKLSDQPATVTVTIPEDAGPKGSIVTSGAAIKIAPNESYTFRAKVDEKSLLPGLKATQAVWDFGDGSPLVPVDLGPNQDGEVKHAFAKEGNFSVKVAIVNNLSNQGKASAPVAVEVNKQFVNVSPEITITDPSTLVSDVYSSKKLSLVFSLVDGNNDPVTYTVDWGDGSQDANTVNNTIKGASVRLEHIYGDDFTSGQREAIIRVNAKDNHGSQGTAKEQTRTMKVAYNTLPTATILSPQASGTLPIPQTGILDGGQGLPKLNGGADEPQIIVIPAGGKIAFDGTGTKPASGDAITYQWIFNGGALNDGKNTSSVAKPGEVTFAGEAGKAIAYKIELQAIDAMKRESKNSPKARCKWVIVDGQNAQTFRLSYLYKERSDVGAEDRLSLVKTAVNGLDAEISILQDGMINSYKVNNGKREAQIEIPVRSNLPFYVKLGKFGAKDNASYLFRIPNKPGLDPSLEATSGFEFENQACPWNPHLKLVTAEGFSPEDVSPRQRVVTGDWSGEWNHHGMPILGPKPSNYRWLDRLSVPLNNELGSRQWIQNSNLVADITGVQAYQNFAEWMISLLTVEIKDSEKSSSPAASPDELSLVLDYQKYIAGNEPEEKDEIPGPMAPSQSFAATHVGAFRVPKGVTDPYPMHLAGATGLHGAALSGSSSGLFPPVVDVAIRAQLAGIVSEAPGNAALQGGLNSLQVCYNPTDKDRIPNQPMIRNYTGTRSTLSYGEFLWSNVWARPLVTQRTNVGWYDVCRDNYANHTAFRYSNPSAWPAMGGIQGGIEKTSAFDMNVTSGSSFDPQTSPATDKDGAKPSRTGVGRFYWTAYTPQFAPENGSAISRSWLADGQSQQIPLASALVPNEKEPTSMWGFTTPLDPVVDKRGRNADGTLNGHEYGGYRVNWFNPTRNAVQEVVAPDFWVIVLEAEGQTNHFLLPGNYPGSGAQGLGEPILTDARSYLPSGDTVYKDGDKIGPGYCWFDIPLELRPQKTNSAFLTIFAVRSINSGDTKVLPRPLNRTEWVESVKTFFPGMKVTFGSGGLDMTYGHKMSVKYPWNVVVSNSARVEVKP